MTLDVCRRSLNFLHQTNDSGACPDMPRDVHFKDVLMQAGVVWPPPVSSTAQASSVVAGEHAAPKGAQKAFTQLVEQESNLLMAFGR